MVKILLVDDEEDLRVIYRMFLEEAGYEVLDACNGNEAWQVLQTQAVSLLVSDLRMPGGGGLELLERIHAEGLACPQVIFMSGFSEMTEESQRSKGVAAVLDKPFAPEALVATVARIQPLEQ